MLHDHLVILSILPCHLHCPYHFVYTVWSYSLSSVHTHLVILLSLLSISLCSQENLHFCCSCWLIITKSELPSSKLLSSTLKRRSEQPATRTLYWLNRWRTSNNYKYRRKTLSNYVSFCQIYISIFHCINHLTLRAEVGWSLSEIVQGQPWDEIGASPMLFVHLLLQKHGTLSCSQHYDNDYWWCLNYKVLYYLLHVCAIVLLMSGKKQAYFCQTMPFVIGLVLSLLPYYYVYNM